ncbi:DNA dC-_dU-editing enzyme APOBEC-3C-like isoform X1 [Rousettus aegyptiacus]|uniref:DNA dC->dU-editing enzyme APOBEC-3C-like isoform X1 n=1 Tax=Rousettus aegyptiacus TaxID=9407 RepID=UPI00168D2454|nr:DNA dC->dU-editing enzyme APOBEC-3C-like isoform X1 [Rousettus aegyptiacus]
MYLQGWREVTEAWREGYTRKPWIRNPKRRLYHDYFYFHFYNWPTPKKRYGCYICYQVEGTRNHSRMPLLRGVFENEFYPSEKRHAELCFLSWFDTVKTSLDMKLSPGEKCHVTWYTSWSPCFECVDEVVEFLRSHRNVELSIFAARLYHSKRWEYRQGLRKLLDAGVQLAIMSYDDFEDCVNNFVSHKGRAFCPWDDLDENSKYLSNMLEDILQNQEE